MDTPTAHIEAAAAYIRLTGSVRGTEETILDFMYLLAKKRVIELGCKKPRGCRMKRILRYVKDYEAVHPRRSLAGRWVSPRPLLIPTPIDTFGVINPGGV